MNENEKQIRSEARIMKFLKRRMQFKCTSLSSCINQSFHKGYSTTISSNQKPVGLSVYYLKHTLLQELEDLGYHSKLSIHDIEDLNEGSGFFRSKGAHRICEKDNKLGVSYVDCIEGNECIGPATIYLSYSHETAIEDIVECLCEYCISKKLDPKATYIWIDAFCMNQHRNAEDFIVRKSAAAPDLYRNSYEGRIKSFDTVVCIFSSWRRPLYLSRVRCLFELHTCLKYRIECEVLMPKHDKELFINNYRTNGAEIILDNYYSISIEDSMLEESDVREAIHLFEHESEAANVNITIASFLRKWCMDVLVWGLVDYKTTYNYVNKSQNYMRPIYRSRVKITRRAIKAFPRFFHESLDDESTDFNLQSSLSKKDMRPVNYDNPLISGVSGKIELSSISLNLQLEEKLPSINVADLLESSIQPSSMNFQCGTTITRGVSVAFLKEEFLGQLKSNGYNPFETNIYDIIGSIIKEQSKNTYCSIDNRKGAAYVDCLEDKYVGDSTYFLSYCWAYRVGHIVGSLEDHCVSKNLDPANTFLWMDCFCVNQHRMAETKHSTQFEDVKEKFESQVLCTGHVLAMLLPWHSPIYFKRAWCMFEIYCALEADVKVTVIMSPNCKKGMMNFICSDQSFALCHLYQVMASVNIESAVASNPLHLSNILRQIRDGPGYEIFNNTLSIFITRWIDSEFGYILNGYKSANLSLDQAKFFNITAYSLSEKGQYDHSIAQYERSLKFHEEFYGTNHTNTAIICNNLGCTLHNDGKCEDALCMHKKALSIRETQLGNEHEHTASSYNNIGCIMLDLERIDDAKRCFQLALKIYQKVLGSKRPQLASTYHNIGCALQIEGELLSGLAFHRKALQIQLLTLGKYHPETASSYQEISDLHNHLGNDEKASEYQNEAFRIRKKTLGLHHSHTDISRKRKFLM